MSQKKLFVIRYDMEDEIDRREAKTTVTGY